MDRDLSFTFRKYAVVIFLPKFIIFNTLSIISDDLLKMVIMHFQSG